MSRSSLDYDMLNNLLIKRTFKLKDVEHQLEKVAFDIVRFKEDDLASKLWQIQKDKDGDYIIALYEDSANLEKTASLAPAVKATSSANAWQVIASGENLNIFYKNTPIAKIAGKKLGFSSNEDLQATAKFLPNSLASNKKLASSLLKEVDDAYRKELIKKYPELG